MPRLSRVAFALALGLTAAPVHRAAAWTFDWAGRVELDAEGLTSDDPQKRLDAVTDLGKYDIALTEQHLLRALDDPDRRVRNAAAKTLGQGGSRKAVPRLIEWLSSGESKTKQVAAGALGDIGGPDATQALTRTLGDTDDAVRLQAVKAVGEIGKRGNPNVVLALIPRLEDTKTDIKLATIAQLEELGDRRAVIPLVAKFGDHQIEARKAAVRAVGRLGDRSAVPALIRLIDDPSEDVRTAAVGALGSLGAVEAIDALTEKLGTGGDSFRTKVAYALGQIAGTPGAGKAGEEAMTALVELLAQPQQRAAARDALRVAGKAAVPALVLHLQGRIKGDPSTAVQLLADTGDRRATSALAAELERGRVPVPIVLRALGATHDPAALVPVLRALSSKDATIRLAAMESLRPLIGSDARAGDVLIEHLADEDLELRVLAAEYLGLLGIASAVPKLATLAKAGNPARLRHAAVDALGEIGRPEATPTLVDVLRNGPIDLASAAATALSYIADPAAVAPLMKILRGQRGTTRYQVVRALGATLRAKPDADARKLLRDLTSDNQVKVSIAAITALAAADAHHYDATDAAFLRTVVERGTSDRRRAAAWALGEIHDAGAIDVLASNLGDRDDRFVGDAVWALGEIAVSRPTDPKVAALVDRWLYLAKHGGWAAAANGTGAFARLLWVVPAASRNKLLEGDRRKTLLSLSYHRSRLVRLNLVHALGALSGDDVAQTLARMVRHDASLHVRAAAASNLARVGGRRVAPTLARALEHESDPLVKAAIVAAKAGPPPPPPARPEWRVFQVVDPGADDAPVRQTPYFIHASDGVVWATYTDARGELASEHVPAKGETIVWPASRENEY